MERLSPPEPRRRWCVFFDRDGTLNAHVWRAGRRTSARHEQEWTALPGIQECFGRLRAAGALIGLVTNQPDLSRGLSDRTALDRMHHRLGPLDGVFVCPHTACRRCACRKPAGGLLRQAAEELSVDLSDSYMVGDRPTDAQAGIGAGCTAVLLTPRVPPRPSLIPGLHYATDLVDAAGTVLRHHRTADRHGHCPPTAKETPR
ncbi:D-glycero-alpha-D-manno-heptose-1,7-bisphosphate 7-phosphatase [Streptomyces sp. NRRL S-340]|uniref:D-glycero-alpha-D-manno-heptose-1,7-bisphosphate 7-phosphatase n=1 Tax=Streptomyces sp. NRRL S-340 TaxID=1463901 RepID=UPI00131CC828|nr:HAD-IIIA family hydrolase [Streptomyces sp. NRRL S-340]